MALRYAVDTNVLLRLLNRNNRSQPIIAGAFRRLAAADVELCYTRQNVAEFWNVSTRPADRNGFGLSVEETEAQVRAIERSMILLAEDQRVYGLWRNLLLACAVRGVQVHDAYLAATLEAHGVTHLLTFNTADFRRFPAVIAVHPDQVQV